MVEGEGQRTLFEECVGEEGEAENEVAERIGTGEIPLVEVAGTKGGC